MMVPKYTQINFPYSRGWGICLHMWKRVRGRVKDFEQRTRVYNAVHYNTFFPRGPLRPRDIEAQCSNTFKPTFQGYQVICPTYTNWPTCGYELINPQLRSDYHYVVTKCRRYVMTIIPYYRHVLQWLAWSVIVIKQCQKIK